eukprot:g6683.t1
MHSAVPKKKKQRREGPLLRRTLSDQQLAETSHDPQHFAPGRSLVLKFGGSSVGSGDRLRGCVGLIRTEIAAAAAAAAAAAGVPGAGKDIAVVVSAQGNTTDDLIDAADYAQAGRLEEAHLLVDRIADLAT